MKAKTIEVEGKTITATSINNNKVRVTVADEDDFDASTIKKGHSDTLLYQLRHLRQLIETALDQDKARVIRS